MYACAMAKMSKAAIVTAMTGKVVVATSEAAAAMTTMDETKHGSEIERNSIS